MKFSVAAVIAFAASALAKPILLNSNYQIEEDTPFTLKWSNAQGPVTITLMTGNDPNNLKRVSDLATGVSGTEYTFTLSDLPSGKYAIRITDSTEPNYSPQFNYVGTGTLPSSSSSVSSATRTSSASATSTASSSSSSESHSSSATSSSAASTSTSFTTTTTSSPSTTRAATQTTAPVNSNNGQRFASPLAFVLVTVAALVFFN